MDRKIRLGLDYRSITEVLFTWIGQNNTESVGYEMKKKGSGPKITGWCPRAVAILPGNNIRSKSKRNNDNINNNNSSNKIIIIIN